MFKAEWNQAPNILSRIQPPINMSSTVYILLLLTANFIFDESLKPQRPVKTGTALNFLEPGLTCIHNCRLSPSYSEVALISSPAAAPDIKGHAGALECFYAGGLSGRPCQNRGWILMTTFKLSHVFRSSVHPPLFFHSELEYFYLGILTVLMWSCK